MTSHGRGRGMRRNLDGDKPVGNVRNSEDVQSPDDDPARQGWNEDAVAREDAATTSARTTGEESPIPPGFTVEDLMAAIESQEIRRCTKGIKMLCNSENTLRSVIEEIHRRSLESKTFGTQAARALSEVSQFEVCGTKLRDVVLRCIQNDFKGRNEMMSEDMNKYLRAVNLLCEVFNHMRLADGTVINVLSVPILEYFNSLLSHHTAPTISLLGQQIQTIGEEVQRSKPEKFSDFLVKVRQLIIDPGTTINQESRCILLHILESYLLRWPSVLPEKTKDFYCKTLGERYLSHSAKNKAQGETCDYNAVDQGRPHYPPQPLPPAMSWDGRPVPPSINRPPPMGPPHHHPPFLPTAAGGPQLPPHLPRVFDTPPPNMIPPPLNMPPGGGPPLAQPPPMLHPPIREQMMMPPPPPAAPAAVANSYGGPPHHMNGVAGVGNGAFPPTRSPHYSGGSGSSGLGTFLNGGEVQQQSMPGQGSSNGYPGHPQMLGPRQGIGGGGNGWERGMSPSHVGLEPPQQHNSYQQQQQSVHRADSVDFTGGSVPASSHQNLVKIAADMMATMNLPADTTDLSEDPTLGPAARSMMGGGGPGMRPGASAAGGSGWNAMPPVNSWSNGDDMHSGGGGVSNPGGVDSMAGGQGMNSFNNSKGGWGASETNGGSVGRDWSSGGDGGAGGWGSGSDVNGGGNSRSGGSGRILPGSAARAGGAMGHMQNNVHGKGGGSGFSIGTWEMPSDGAAASQSSSASSTTSSGNSKHSRRRDAANFANAGRDNAHPAYGHHTNSGAPGDASGMSSWSTAGMDNNNPGGSAGWGSAPAANNRWDGGNGGGHNNQQQGVGGNNNNKADNQWGANFVNPGKSSTGHWGDNVEQNIVAANNSHHNGGVDPGSLQVQSKSGGLDWNAATATSAENEEASAGDGTNGSNAGGGGNQTGGWGGNSATDNGTPERIGSWADALGSPLGESENGAATFSASNIVW